VVFNYTIIKRNHNKGDVMKSVGLIVLLGVMLGFSLPTYAETVNVKIVSNLAKDISIYCYDNAGGFCTPREKNFTGNLNVSLNGTEVILELGGDKGCVYSSYGSGLETNLGYGTTVDGRKIRCTKIEGDKYHFTIVIYQN